MSIEVKFVTDLMAKIEEQDKRSIELMASGTLKDPFEYGMATGYRRAYTDFRTLINETFEDVMKE